ncbi:unnamed protein product [Adineta steineri]|uniref:Arrestin C-terminal-like domain-containing protein n=1 Tax=Adineta steineri TaxID=433720 RepID=A0A815LG90_9BILA|nr:unnamed protein product [Adineta steineri]CAF1405645.1 unnamed protein product [Adineta steineri]CAF1472068.1 unnamed protein product [Adineta steineri]CAF1636127.1 unnamed protein product [Adineta steineri]
MGANESVSIRINFNRSNRFYFTGEQVSGNISIDNLREKVKLDEIFIELVGELGYTTQEIRTKNDSNGKSTSENYTSYHHIPFLTTRLPLIQPHHVQDQMILSRGHYTWPFEFTLPESLPPTTQPNLTVYPNVRYLIRIVLDKPWYKFNQTQAYLFTVCPKINLSYQTIHFNKQNRKQLQFEGCLLRNGIIPGQSFSIQIKLQNPERTKIKRIEVAFIQHRQTSVDRHKEIILSADLPGFYEFDGASLQQTFELPLPNDYIAPTYSFETSWHNHPYRLIIEYELILTIKPHGFFTKFEVSVPVIVGTQSNHENQIQEKYDEKNTYQMVDELEPPPSYESIVNTK